MTRTLRIVPLLLLAMAAAPYRAEGTISGSVSGSSVSLSVTLPLGLGVDVSLGFDDVSGLSLANLGLSAQLINPVDPVFASRLPPGVLPSTLPILLRIEPPANGGLAFHGTAHFEIHTHNLGFYLATPLRFFSAPVGGPFRDVTTGLGAGSYRARGTTGGFSEFLIAVDFRPIDTVIVDKFNRLDAMLDSYEGTMAAPVYADLEAKLDAARGSYQQGALATAVSRVDLFLAAVSSHAGTDIPDVWRAARDLQNVAGYLRAGAETLRFSLDRKRVLGF